MANFHIGQEVVCIEGDWKSVLTGGMSHGPEKREVCVVTRLAYFNNALFLGLVGYDPDEVYEARVFRPVVKTDITVFTAMLNRAPSVPADRELIS